jgi:hypothetical protein
MIADIALEHLPPHEDGQPVPVERRRHAAAFAGVIEQDLLAVEGLAMVVRPAEGDAAALERLAFGFRLQKIGLVEPAGVDASLRRDREGLEALAAFGEKRLRGRKTLAAVRGTRGEDRADHLLVGPRRIARKQRSVGERDDLGPRVAMGIDHAVGDGRDRRRRGEGLAAVRGARDMNRLADREGDPERSLAVEGRVDGHGAGGLRLGAGRGGVMAHCGGRGGRRRFRIGRGRRSGESGGRQRRKRRENGGAAQETAT